MASNNYLQEFYKDMKSTLDEIVEDALKFFKENKKAFLAVVGVYLFWKWFLKKDDEIMRAE